MRARAVAAREGASMMNSSLFPSRRQQQTTISSTLRSLPTRRSRQPVSARSPPTTAPECLRAGILGENRQPSAAPRSVAARVRGGVVVTASCCCPPAGHQPIMDRCTRGFSVSLPPLQSVSPGSVYAFHLQQPHQNRGARDGSFPAVDVVDQNQAPGGGGEGGGHVMHAVHLSVFSPWKKWWLASSAAEASLRGWSGDDASVSLAMEGTMSECVYAAKAGRFVLAHRRRSE